MVGSEGALALVLTAPLRMLETFENCEFYFREMKYFQNSEKFQFFGLEGEAPIFLKDFHMKRENLSDWWIRCRYP